MAKKPHMNLLFCGHVDHGKSTAIGRIFFETGVLDPRELEKYKKEAEEYGKVTWEFAFATDETKEERKKGVTIELSHKKFETSKYYFTIIDAPGHRDFVKNMITGASQADAAVLFISAKDGPMPQTREHAYLCKVLGVKQMIVAVSFMDAVGYKEERYNEVKEASEKLLKNIGYKVDEIPFVAVSGLKGDNLTKPSENISWFKGTTLLTSLDKLKLPEKPVDLPLRLPVQGAYTIKGIGTVPVGRVVTGVLNVNDIVVFEPAGVQGEVKSIEMHHENIQKAEPGDNIGFNVRGVGREAIDRGDVVGRPDNPPTVVKEFTAQIIVLNHPTVIAAGYTPVFHCHTAQVACKFTELLKKIDPRTGEVIQEKPDFIKNGDVAIVKIVPSKPMVIEERTKIPQLSNFAIRDMGQTIAAGTCIEITQKR